MVDRTTDTAIAFFIFNRPSTTRRVFDRIAAAKPPRLYVIADGPRTEHPEDERKCRQVREITEEIDWDCDVYRDYARENLGLKERFVTGLEWVFDNEREAIILEDDCVPIVSVRNNYSLWGDSNGLASRQS